MHAGCFFWGGCIFIWGPTTSDGPVIMSNWVQVGVEEMRKEDLAVEKAYDWLDDPFRRSVNQSHLEASIRWATIPVGGRQWHHDTVTHWHEAFVQSLTICAGYLPIRLVFMSPTGDLEHELLRFREDLSFSYDIAYTNELACSTLSIVQ